MRNEADHSVFGEVVPGSLVLVNRDQLADDHGFGTSSSAHTCLTSSNRSLFADGEALYASTGIPSKPGPLDP